jgi:hypothetical protein
MKSPGTEKVVGLSNGDRPCIWIPSKSSQTFLVVKEAKIVMAKEVFQETGISVTEEGKRHLGAAIGTPAFVECYKC